MGDFDDREVDEERGEDNGDEELSGLEDRRCLNCGELLVGKINPRRLYCDGACKKAAYKKRYRARKKVEKITSELAFPHPATNPSPVKSQARRKGSWRMQMMRVWIISGFVVVVVLMVLIIVIEWLARGG